MDSAGRCGDYMLRSLTSRVTSPPLSDTRDWLERLLAELRPSPSLRRQDIDRLHVKLDALTPAVFESSLPAQALHGDASMSNLLRTESGLVWNDLEDVAPAPSRGTSPGS